MKSLPVLLLVLCWIVPLVSSQNCRELLVEGWQPDQPIAFPDGFSLRDIFTARAETTGGKGKAYFLHLRSGAQYVARTSLSPKGKFTVMRPDDVTVQAFSMSDLVDTRTGSLLLQMRCDERSTTCRVTSQTNTALEVFNYQPEVPRFLSTNRIEVSNFVLEIFNPRSILLCKPREPSVITEVIPSGPVREGESYSLICRVRGLPVLAASWSKNEVELEDATAQLDQVESMEEQTLTLTYIVAELRREDLGRYVCKGKSLLVSEEGARSDVSLIMSIEEEEEEGTEVSVVTTTESVKFFTKKTEGLDNKTREPSTAGSEENESESGGSEGTESNNGDSGSGESEGNEDGSAEGESHDEESDGNESDDTVSEGNDPEKNNEGDSDGTESSDKEGSDSTNSGSRSSNTSQPLPMNEICKFLGQNITKRTTMNFPESFNISDVVTIRGNFTGSVGHIFYLRDDIAGSDWLFYRYKDGTTLSTYNPYAQLQLFNHSSQTTLKIQVFHEQSTESLNIITPYAAKAITKFERSKLEINKIEVFVQKNSHYDFISICRRQDPEITLTVTPHNYTLGDTITLLCTLTGPPFLSGYWIRKGVVISSQDTLNETKAEQTLELKLVLSNLYTGDLGEYTCYGRGSLMAPNVTLERRVDLTYQKPITITKPASNTYNLLPTSFTWRVEGYPFKNLVMKCTDVDVIRSTPLYRTPNTPPYQFDVTLEENLEKFNCTLLDGKDIVEIFQFTKCGNGSHILDGRCVPCLAGQNSSVLTNYTCIRDKDSEDETEEDGNKEEEEKEEEEEDQGDEVDEPNDEEQKEDEENEEILELDEKDGRSNKNSLPAIIGSCVGVAVLVMITVIVILVLMKKRRTKERELRRRASESQVRNRTISAPILHYHISGEVSEVTISTNIRMRSSSLERSTAIPDTEVASTSNAEPVYATVSKPVKPNPCQSEEKKEDLYSNLDREPRKPSELRHKEPIYNDAKFADSDTEFADSDAEFAGNDAEPVYNNIDLACKNKESAYNDIESAYNDIESAYNDGGPVYAKVNKPPADQEDEEESAYADLEYVGKVRKATGSIVKKEESVDPTYATITEFQKAEETEEQFDFTDV